MSDHAAALGEYVGAFLDEAWRAGVRDVCLCPGSRSTPLAILARSHPDLRTTMHLDERSAAFFALGIGKATGRPAAVVCTSGTAAANFYPAIVEARYGRVPLLVLTADRPAELRGIGANQTIDQVRMYGSHARWAEEMLLPEATPAALRYVRSVAHRAVAVAVGDPPGPVHMNFPFREPLVPRIPNWRTSDTRTPAVVAAPAAARPDPAATARLAADLASGGRGLMVCGPADHPGLPGAVLALAAALDVPVIADALSQVRCGPAADLRVIESFDAFLRSDEVVARLRPDYVLRLGASPVSKPLAQYLERNADCRQVVVDSAGEWTDQQRAATDFFFADPATFCDDLRAAVGSAPVRPVVAGARSAWLRTWQRLDAAAAASLAAALDAEDAMTEPGVFRRLARLLPAGASVFAGNSMPVRDLDSFFPRSATPLRFLANRGASGIDGVVSTALGAASVGEGPLVLVLGDLSLYHDMNGLLAVRKLGVRATIVVVNNDGGGIFSFLPQADQGEHFEELFGTPHGLDFCRVADVYGLDYTLTRTGEQFDAAVSRSLAGAGASLIEVRTDRQENFAWHRKLWAAAAAAAASA